MADILKMEVCEGETSTASRNPSPSLPEGASTSTNEGPTPMELGPSALPMNGKATSEPSTSSSCSSENGEASSSACEEAGSSGSCEKAGRSGSVEGDESSDSVSVSEAVVTDAMLKEEQRLHDAESRENSMEREKVTELRGMVEHQRYLRLQHLLERSTIYSRFMLKQMEDQRDKEKKEEEKRQKKNTNKPTKEKADEGQTEGRSTRSGASLKSPEVRGQPPSGRGGKKRGRKRKAEESASAFKISDFVDSQGQLKKRKLESGGEAGGDGGTAKAQQAEEQQNKTGSGGVSSGGSGRRRKKARKEAAEEIAEQRYFKGQLIPAQQPKLFTGGIMRSYQIDGMEWVKVLYENGVNGILGDEMGLGKTIQCIAVIAHMIEMGVKGPFLVAAPLSTVPNWVAEFKKFTPTIPVVLYHGTQDERMHLRRTIFRGASLNKKKKKGSTGGQQSGEVVLPVVVTSYEICMRDQQYLMNRSWKFLVVDEGHRIKNLNCKLIKALKSYDAANRLLLTGTPLQNNLAELWSLLNFLLPDIFDDLNSFQSWFDFDTSGDDFAKERIIAQEREQNVLKTLHQILTPFLLRRLKTDVEFSLPPKKEVLVYAPLTPYQEKYYKSLLNNTIFEMMEKEEKKKMAEMKKKGKENLCRSGEGGGVEGEGEMECCDDTLEERRVSRQRKAKAHYSQLSDSQFEQILSGEADLEEFVPTKKKEEKDKKVVLSVKDIKMTSVFTMLRKCCNHPYLLEFPLTPDGDFLIDDQIVSSCGKVLLLDRMLPALLQRGHKTLIFSQFTSMLDILEDYLEMRGLVCSRLDGTMGFAERERQMTMFRESPDCHIFLLSTRAGGLGINLTNADTVIIYDSDWNPQCDLQAQDRCHRIGQTKPVMVYRFVTANTIDQRIVERAASKRRLEKMVIHKGKFKGKANEIDLSLDDLVELLHSVDHHKVVDSQDAVMSDEQLEALLDRTLTTQEKKIKSESTSMKSSRSSAPGDQSLFRVIEERDTKGNIIRDGDDSAPTTDTWHIIGENDGDLNAEGKEGEDTNGMAVTSSGGPTVVDGDLKDGVAEMDASSGGSSDQVTSSTDGRDQNESSGVIGDHEESNAEEGANQGESNIQSSSNIQTESSNLQPSTPTINGCSQAENFNSNTIFEEDTKTDEIPPATVDGDACSNVKQLPNSSKLETAREDLAPADVENCGSTETPVIESDYINDVGGLDTQPDAAYSSENNGATAKATVCMARQVASNPETMDNDCDHPAILEGNNDESEPSNYELDIPNALIMNEA